MLVKSIVLVETKSLALLICPRDQKSSVIGSVFNVGYKAPSLMIVLLWERMT